jgi:hypothetical protein
MYQDSNEDAGFRKHFEERITEAIDIVRNIQQQAEGMKELLKTAF